MFENTFFVLSLTCVLYTNAGPVIDIQKCKGNDDACITASAAQIAPVFIEGMPEIGLTSLDPLHVDYIDASTDSLVFKINDVDVSGFKTCKFNRVTRDAQESKIYVDMLCNIHLEGQYEINGRVLVIPIQGKGKLTADLQKTEINFNADIKEKKGKDDKQHWSITKWNYVYNLKDKSHLNFENLFPGNELLGQAARNVISQNGNEVVQDIGEPVIKSIVGKVVEHVQKFFKSLPIENLAIA